MNSLEPVAYQKHQHMDDDIEDFRSSDSLYNGMESPTPSFPRNSQSNEIRNSQFMQHGQGRSVAARSGGRHHPCCAHCPTDCIALQLLQRILDRQMTGLSTALIRLTRET
jgi:hypothetical protein